MKLKSFELRPAEELSLDPGVRGWQKAIQGERDHGTEHYEITDVTPVELKAWDEIAQKLSKAGIWLQWTHSMPRAAKAHFASFKEFANGPILLYDISITIEHRPGFSMKDYFNDQFKLSE